MVDNQDLSNDKTIKVSCENSRKPQRNRRRNRKKNKEKVLCEPPAIQFKIEPISKPQCGFPIRLKQIRDCKLSKINIHQFMLTGCTCYTFLTNMKRIPPTAKIGKENKVNKVKLQNNEEFTDYISKEEALEGLSNGTLVKGVLRINPNNFRQAFCTNMNPSEPDYCIDNILSRNRALEGDVVAMRLNKDGENGKKSNKYNVVYILEKVHTRIAVGFLDVTHISGKPTPILVSRDTRFPTLQLTAKNLPHRFIETFKKYKSTLFSAMLTEWRVPNYAIGEIVEKIGQAMDVANENKVILMVNQINVKEFTPEMLAWLPKSYDITEEDISQRLDVRNECVFTIDPKTARDLDDALHIKELPNGNYEVGVHIADVTHFLHEDTPLDAMVASKATSIYFVEQVFHMLPKEFCMSCSLLPGRDSLAFSVIWELTPDADIVSTKFARTVINSCAQMAYEDAQSIIKGGGSNNITLPQIHGGFKAADISKSVLQLHALAQILRKMRYASGALKIQQTKISFRFNAAGAPAQFFVEEQCEANYLIEEFMLLANISVAQKIYGSFPDIAFLRCHDDPVDRMMKQVRDRLEVMGIHLNFDTSVEIQKSLDKFKALGPTERAKYVALNHMLTKPMKQARYFCSQGIPYGNFHHFGLSIPIYTHFTSPIRRYADVMVHRLLAACLGLRDKPNWDVGKVERVAEQCNKMKFSAKRAGEASCNLALARYIKAHPDFAAKGVVVGVAKKYFEVVVLVTGSVVRLFIEELEKTKKCEVMVNTENVGDEDMQIYNWTINWHHSSSKCTQTIDIFHVVPVRLIWRLKRCQFSAELLPPDANVKF